MKRIGKAKASQNDYNIWSNWGAMQVTSILEQPSYIYYVSMKMTFLQHLLKNLIELFPICSHIICFSLPVPYIGFSSPEL